MNPPVIVTLWASRSNTLGRRDAQTWEGFLAKYVAAPEIALRKESVGGFALASFVDNRRGLAGVEKVFALVFDLDQGDTTIGQAARLFPRTRAAIYTTWSSTPEKPKLRIILLLSRPVSGEEHARLWCWAAAKFKRAGHVLDESTRDASRLWYIPSYRPGGDPYEWRELKGRPLDVGATLKTGSARAPLLPEGKAPKTGSRRSGPQEVAEAERPPASESFWGRAFELAGKAFHSLKNGQLAIVCPWADQHTRGVDGDGSTVILPATADGWGLFYCRHAHCAKRQTFDLLEALPAAALEAARIDHGAGLVCARVVRGFVQRFDAHDGLPELNRLVLWCVPVGFVARGGFRLTVKIGSATHQALGSLPLSKLLGRLLDVARRGESVTWGRLVSANPKFRSFTPPSSVGSHPRRAAGTR